MMLIPNKLIKKLGCDNLKTRRQNLKAETVYKSINGLVPVYLSSKFILRSDMVTPSNLRHSENEFAVPLLRTIIVIRGTGYETLKPSKARTMSSQSMLN